MRRSGSGDSAPSRSQSSRTSRVLPTPASAMIVTRCGSPLLDATARRSRAAARARRRGRRRRRCSPPTPRGRISVSAPQERHADDAAVLALRLDASRLAELERAAHERRRALADQDLARRRRLLEPSCDVDGVAGDERAALARPADDDLAGVDADAQRRARRRRASAGDGASQARVQRALGVILERGGRAERRHHCIAGELLHRPARALDLGRHRVVEAIEQSRACARGPARLPSAVEPTRSAKRTVASFRSSAGGATSVGAPHAGTESGGVRQRGATPGAGGHAADSDPVSALA